MYWLMQPRTGNKLTFESLCESTRKWPVLAQTVSKHARRPAGEKDLRFSGVTLPLPKGYEANTARFD